MDHGSLTIMGASAAAASFTTWIADAVVRKASPRTRSPVRTLVPLAFPLGVAALGIASSVVDASRHLHQDGATLDLLTAARLHIVMSRYNAGRAYSGYSPP